jgi:hypothetical protein
MAVWKAAMLLTTGSVIASNVVGIAIDTHQCDGEGGLMSDCGLGEDMRTCGATKAGDSTLPNSPQQNEVGQHRWHVSTIHQPSAYMEALDQRPAQQLRRPGKSFCQQIAALSRKAFFHVAFRSR